MTAPITRVSRDTHFMRHSHVVAFAFRVVLASLAALSIAACYDDSGQFTTWSFRNNSGRVVLVIDRPISGPAEAKWLVDKGTYAYLHWPRDSDPTGGSRTFDILDPVTCTQLATVVVDAAIHHNPSVTLPETGSPVVSASSQNSDHPTVAGDPSPELCP